VRGKKVLNLHKECHVSLLFSFALVLESFFLSFFSLHQRKEKNCKWKHANQDKIKKEREKNFMCHNSSTIIMSSLTWRRPSYLLLSLIFNNNMYNISDIISPRWERRDALFISEEISRINFGLHMRQPVKVVLDLCNWYMLVGDFL